MINRIILQGAEAINFIEQNNVPVRSYEQARIDDLAKELESFNIDGYSKVELKYNFVQYENGLCDLSFVEPLLIVDGIEYSLIDEGKGRYSLQVPIQSYDIARILYDYRQYAITKMPRPSNVGKATKKKIADWVEYCTAYHNSIMDVYTKALETNQEMYKQFNAKYPDLLIVKNHVNGWVKSMVFFKKYEDHEVRYELTAEEKTGKFIYMNSRIWRSPSINDLLK